MKKSELSFMDGFNPMGKGVLNKLVGNPLMAFNWDKAAEIIKEKLKLHPDLKAEAGLQGDWDYTGGIIFEDGKPTNDSYTYLCSNWATPTLILEWNGMEQEQIDCSTEESERFNAKSKWDETSINILGVSL
jgi:hypothetical protein